MSLSSRNERKRKGRSKNTGEIFTPPWLVNQMIDKLPPKMWEPERTVCDPACGNGNMLLEVLRRKLDKGHAPLKALSTTYGVDCMSDNIRECRLRLLKLVQERGHRISSRMVVEVLNNLVVTPIGKKYPKGALDYDFEFPRTIKAGHPLLAKWVTGIRSEGWLDGVTI